MSDEIYAPSVQRCPACGQRMNVTDALLIDEARNEVRRMGEASAASFFAFEKKLRPNYSVRKCRGHWHVQMGDGTHEDDLDLALPGDPFKTEEEARAAMEQCEKGLADSGKAS